MSYTDVQKQVMEYQQLLMQGVPAREAFQRAFPNGIPTAADRAKEQAKAQQKAGYGQVGGLLAGALGTKLVYDAVAGKGGAIASKVGSMFGGSSPTAVSSVTDPVTGAVSGGGSAVGGGAGGGAALGEEAATQAPEAAGSYSMLGPYAAMAYTAYQGLKGAQRIKQGKGLTGQQQVLLALPTFGGSLLYNSLHRRWDRNEWQNEGNDLRSLQNSGTYVPQNLIDSMPTRGRSKDELLQIAKDTGGNQQFAVSRNESDLTPVDIVNYSAFAKNDPNWFNRSLDERLATAKQYLDAGAVREAKGQIFLDHSKVPGVQITRPAVVPPNKAMQAATLKQNGKFGDQLIQALRG